MTDKMRDDAIREAARNAALDEYFNARPQLMRTRHEECLVEAGFDRGWQAAQAEQSEQSEQSMPVVDIDATGLCYNGVHMAPVVDNITTAELERLRKDAARYRWLSYNASYSIHEMLFGKPASIKTHKESDLDYCIDAAVAGVHLAT